MTSGKASFGGIAARLASAVLAETILPFEENRRLLCLKSLIDAKQ